MILPDYTDQYFNYSTFVVETRSSTSANATLSDFILGNVSTAPEPKVTKKADLENVYTGDEAGFTVQIENVGTGDLLNLALSDALPPLKSGNVWRLAKDTVGPFVIKGLPGSQTLELEPGTTLAYNAPAIKAHVVAWTKAGDHGVLPNTAKVHADNQNINGLRENHESTASITVTERPVLTITASDKTKIYGKTISFAGTNPPDFTYDGLLDGDQIDTVTLTSTDGLAGSATTGVGTYEGNIVPTDAKGVGLSKYTIDYKNGKLTVEPQKVTITADAKSKTYGEADPALTYQITYGALVNGDTFSGSLTRVAGEAVGSYAIQQGTVALNANYTLTYVGANLTVGKRLVTITADPKTKTYGTVDPALTYQITSGTLAFSDVFSGRLNSRGG